MRSRNGAWSRTARTHFEGDGLERRSRWRFFLDHHLECLFAECDIDTERFRLVGRREFHHRIREEHALAAWGGRLGRGREGWQRRIGRVTGKR
jgi:hypothetical protein